MALETKIIDLLRKTKLGAHPTIGKFLADLAIYQPIGLIPGRIQQDLGEKSGIDGRTFALYQISLATAIATARYFIGESAENIEYLGYAGIAMKIWSIDSFLTNSARLWYMVATKKPIGSLTLEFFYLLGRGVSRKTKETIERYKKEKKIDL